MPALRDHASDIPAIAARMIEDMNERHNCAITGIAPALLNRLLAYDWPGNARELRNTVERATILAGTGLIGVEHLPPHFGEPGYATRFIPASELAVAAPQSAAREREDDHTVHVEVGTTVDEAERQLILKTLHSTHNNKTRAAEILGITTKTLQNKLKEYANTAASNGSSPAAIDPSAAVAE
jgi:DNA-binding NtrC family response regulator